MRWLLVGVMIAAERRGPGTAGELACSEFITCVMRSLPPAAVCRSTGLAIVWLGSGWLVESAHRLSGLSHTASM